MLCRCASHNVGLLCVAKFDKFVITVNRPGYVLFGEMRGHRKSMRLRTFIATVLLMMTAVIAWAPVAQAADEGFSGSYITPFPKGDVYRVQVIGDTLAQGLVSPLAAQLAGDARVKVNGKYSWFNRVIRANFALKLRELEDQLRLLNTNIAVVILGPADRRSILIKGKKYWPGQEPWRVAYNRRINNVMKMFKRLGISVYWIGIPVLSKPNANEHAQLMNDVIRENAYIHGFKYIDSYNVFVDVRGGYSAYGPDLDGKTRRLRERDGIHLTLTGSRKLVHFVERDLRRDIRLAREERSVPLIGSEEQQAQIRRAVSGGQAGGSKRRGDRASDWQTETAEAKINPETAQEPRPIRGTSGTSGGGYFGGNGSEQVADDSKVEIKIRDENGDLRDLKFDVVRPAIPSSVVALVTRKQSRNKAAQLGEQMVGQIGGGLSLISTVTPASAALVDSRRRKLSPAQTSFFKVLVQGERLRAKPGRADDVSWPRPKPKTIAPSAKRQLRSKDDRAARQKKAQQPKS